MADRRMYLCRACFDEDAPYSPCVAVTDGEGELGCLHSVGEPEWVELDRVIAAGALSALADEQRGRI